MLRGRGHVASGGQRVQRDRVDLARRQDEVEHGGGDRRHDAALFARVVPQGDAWQGLGWIESP